ncbi:MAG: hypothetical protein K0V04_28340 [Deltaproteobacteria bacterium]|nr:hypothetical protein [Deltaproteobacteria bacterium]
MPVLATIVALAVSMAPNATPVEPVGPPAEPDTSLPTASTQPSGEANAAEGDPGTSDVTDPSDEAVAPADTASPAQAPDAAVDPGAAADPQTPPRQPDGGPNPGEFGDGDEFGDDADGDEFDDGDEFGDDADGDTFGDADSTDLVADYDPRRDSPEALRARHWIRAGIATISAGGVLLIGSVAMAASNPCNLPIGNSCQTDARNRASLVMAVPAVLLLAGGGTALGLGLKRRNAIAVDLQASRHGFGLGVSGRF